MNSQGTPTERLIYIAEYASTRLGYDFLQSGVTPEQHIINCLEAYEKLLDPESKDAVVAMLKNRKKQKGELKK